MRRPKHEDVHAERGGKIEDGLGGILAHGINRHHTDTGAFGEGAWTIDSNKVSVKSTAVLPDGKKAAATLIFFAVDADTLGLQVKDRSVGSEQLPDVPEIKLKRVK